MNFLARLLLLLPRPIALKLGSFLGLLAYYLLKRRRKLALDNFNRALGKDYTPDQQIKMIKTVFMNLSLNFIEFFRFQEITKNNLSQYVTIHGKENLDKVYAQNNGVLILSGHFGNWEFLSASLGLMGYKGGLITKAVHQKSFENFVKKQRAAKNINLFYGKNSIRDILKFLKSGAILGVVADQHGIGRDSIMIPFFNRPASTLKGLAVLAERTGAPVIAAYSYRDEKLHHHIVIEPALISPPDSTPEAKTLLYTQWLEGVIRKHPDQWMWTHNRWK